MLWERRTDRCQMETQELGAQGECKLAALPFRLCRHEKQMLGLSGEDLPGMREALDLIADISKGNKVLIRTASYRDRLQWCEIQR